MSGYAETALVKGMHFLAESQAAISNNLANLETASYKRRTPVATPALVVIPCCGSTIAVWKACFRRIFACSSMRP